MKNYKLTPKEHQKLKKEFEKLFIRQKNFRDAYIRSVQEGDERENDGWYVTHDLNEQNIARLTELDQILKNCVIVEEDHNDKRVGLGDKVVLKINSNKPAEYEIVSFVGIASHTNVVSPESPIGQAIMNSHAGETVEFTNGEKMFKVEIVSVN